MKTWIEYQESNYFGVPSHHLCMHLHRYHAVAYGLFMPPFGNYFVHQLSGFGFRFEFRGMPRVGLELGSVHSGSTGNGISRKVFVPTILHFVLKGNQFVMHLGRFVDCPHHAKDVPVVTG